MYHAVHPPPVHTTLLVPGLCVARDRHEIGAGNFGTCGHDVFWSQGLSPTPTRSMQVTPNLPRCDTAGSVGTLVDLGTAHRCHGENMHGIQAEPDSGFLWKSLLIFTSECLKNDFVKV